MNSKFKKSSNWIDTNSGGSIENTSFVFNPQYIISTEKDCEIMVSLIIKNRNLNGGFVLSRSKGKINPRFIHFFKKKKKRDEYNNNRKKKKNLIQVYFFLISSILISPKL